MQNIESKYHRNKPIKKFNVNQTLYNLVTGENKGNKKNQAIGFLGFNKTYGELFDDVDRLADAMEGKSNKYIEVGFSDYLSKPIDKKELNRVLKKFFNNEETTIIEDKEDPDIHKITPITDEEIERINKLLKEKEEKNNI